MNIPTTPKLAAAAAAVTLLLGSAAAVAATSHPASPHAKSAKNTVYVWVTPGPGATSKILLTGAIGDYGKATSVTKSGKVSANGQYVRIHLQHGTFKVNAVPFNKKLNAAPFHLTKATCSAWAGGSGNVSLFDGTGAYAGISGTLRISTSFALLGPLHKSGPKKGTCNLSDKVQPLSVFQGSITGSGPVSFS